MRFILLATFTSGAGALVLKEPPRAAVLKAPAALLQTLLAHPAAEAFHTVGRAPKRRSIRANVGLTVNRPRMSPGPVVAPEEVEAVKEIVEEASAPTSASR